MLTPGSVLQSRYRIVKTLGVGGMGAVYLALDKRLADREVAVKEMIPDPNASLAEQTQAQQQFQREASLLASLDHPNLPKVYDYFSEGGKHYLVMDYVDGETLEDILKRTPGYLPESQVLDWAAQLCDVLTYLHTRQPPVIFRDLKPGNIMPIVRSF
ncbi:MAG TPA: serine/threonine protein kinase, partial [Anaerolineae bacterium]|nr:serine/threonine protein kinase [Anaerolineae bacterium]